MIVIVIIIIIIIIIIVNEQTLTAVAWLEQLSENVFCQIK